MTDNETNKIPLFDLGILAEAAKQLPKGFSKEYLEKLDILMQLEDDDPILAAAVVMGAFSVIVGQVPAKMEEMLKRVEKLLNGREVLGTLEFRLQKLNAQCVEASRNVGRLKDYLRTVESTAEILKSRVSEAKKILDQQVALAASTTKQTSFMLNWVFIVAGLSSVDIILHVFCLLKLNH